MERYREIDTSGMERPKVGADLYTNRSAIVAMEHGGAAKVSILVQAWNRLEKTKRCVESILTYTRNIDYELVLIDRGSEDGTLEYYKSIEYPKKRILRLTKNLGIAYPRTSFSVSDFGNYVAVLGK